MRLQATQGIKSVIFEGRIVRADGTVEELGQISYWHRNPLKRLSYKIKQRVGRH